MKRILIIGNSGSGKSWLAARLAKQLTIREINLDTIVWQPGGFNQKRPQHEIDHAIQTLAQAPSWVVEGVFGALAEQLLDAADTLLFLDLDWSVCRDSAIARITKCQATGCSGSGKELSTTAGVGIGIWAASR